MPEVVRRTVGRSRACGRGSDEFGGRPGHRPRELIGDFLTAVRHTIDRDKPGFWERNGYHMYGDPFLEQRVWGD